MVFGLGLLVGILITGVIFSEWYWGKVYKIESWYETKKTARILREIEKRDEYVIKKYAASMRGLKNEEKTDRKKTNNSL
jgi:hypothetical protein